MAEAQVAVLRQTFIAGHSRWEQVGAERTNDLGEYRIPALAAGSYFVSVTPPPDFRSLIETSSNATAGAAPAAAASDKPAPAAYQTTYYPGARDPVARWRRLSGKFLADAQPQLNYPRFRGKSAARF